MGDQLAAQIAKDARPPTGRVHLHAFIKRNSLSRVGVYEMHGLELELDRRHRPVAALPKKTFLTGEIEWCVRTRRSSVCEVPGRCILADIVPIDP